MLVLVRELPETRDIDVSSEFVGAVLAGLPMRAALERPDDDPNAGHLHVHLDLYASDDANVFVRGTITGWFEIACSRCLGPVRIKLDERIAVTFVPRNKLPEEDLDRPETDEEGVELGEEDLDLYGYDQETVDLEPLLREQLIMAVPFAPLCSESCKGLCPTCGADLNHEQCACEPPIDPRLAALKNLKV